MTKTKEDSYICALCNQSTDGFYYYEVTTSSLGVLDESSLMIDLCKPCALKVQHNIPKELMRGRYDTDKELPKNTQALMDTLKKIKEQAESRREF